MLFFIGIIVGIALTLIIQLFILYKWFYSLPKGNNTWKPQIDNFSLPKVLKDILNDSTFKNDKESYYGLNFIFQFLFQELKDTKHVRSWVMKRLKQEFTELLHSTTGKLLDQIRVRNFNLGRTLPIINRASVINVSVNKDDLIEDVTLLVDLSYNGHFRLAVDVDMVFGKSAYFSLMLTKLQGSAQLHFTRNPYTHWTFSFVEDPFLTFEVESQFEGRTITQLANIITNQIRRAVHKKYTLPNFKIRYSPFFKIYTAEHQPRDVYYEGKKLTIGNLNIIIVGCTRLPSSSPDSQLYCSLALDTMPWMELLSYRKKLWVAHDLEICKSQPTMGIHFDEEFLLDKFEEVVVVTGVVPGSSAHKAKILKGDIIVAINGTKVTSSKQVTRLIKQMGEKFLLRVERSLSKPSIIGSSKESNDNNKKEKSTDCDSALIPLLCVHG